MNGKSLGKCIRKMQVQGSIVLLTILHGSNSDHGLPTEKDFGPPKVGFQALTK